MRATIHITTIIVIIMLIIAIGVVLWFALRGGGETVIHQQYNWQKVCFKWSTQYNCAKAEQLPPDFGNEVYNACISTYPSYKMHSPEDTINKCKAVCDNACLPPSGG
ncbi:MAG: hypothetical protein QW751_01645 [Candidatus Aenigmatarchaeota archaeon]|nr:hypothetical protein [Candidatus Aenigmarchaeota archaeon]